MSFRELRNFTEYMRSLGYDHVVSMDNFRTPNFTLVADILVWMVDRYDPTVSLSHDISTPEIRVQFITSVAQAMWSKAGIKLNTKKLYAADGRAVRELLKIAEILYKAQQTNLQQERGESMDDLEPVPGIAKLHDVKTARNLATEITDAGATLFDLLREERDLSQKRTHSLRFLEALSNNLANNNEHQFVERSLKEILEKSRDEVVEMDKQCKDQESDLKTLKAKIKKKQADLERNDTRLKTLQQTRPAFMDKYEKLETELAYHYEVYLERFRNLDYLEHELDKYDRAEREMMRENEEALKKIQRRLREEEMTILRGERDVDERAIDDEMSEEKLSNEFNPRRGSASSNGKAEAQASRGRRRPADDDESDISMSDSDSQSGSESSEEDSSSDSSSSDGVADEDESGSESSDGGSDGESGSESDDDF